MSERYGGRLVHVSHDEYGPIEVVEVGRERHLHFGNSASQSAMLLQHQHALTLSYTRAMLTGLLFCDPPERVLLLGLGGGSLVRFVHHHFPECQLDVVELRPKVVEVAQEWFGLPDSPSVSYYTEDALTFLQSRSLELNGNYDLILIDVFDGYGIAPAVAGGHFFALCRDRVADTGVVSINLWSEDVFKVDDYIDELHYQLGGLRLRLPVEGRANVIGLVTRQTRTRRELSQVAAYAASLEAKLDVGLGGFMRQLRKSRPDLRL